MEWCEAGGIEWLQAELPRARVVFTSRSGGTSAAPYDSLNLGLLTDDEPARVAQNGRRLGSALGLERIVFGRQVHGAELIVHEAAPVDPPVREADGHVVSVSGTAALVFAADCLPVALAGPGGVAMLHCGWRGLAAGIVARGAASVGATDAAIGPGIGACCYEVGDEVLRAFEDLGPGVADGRMLDLAEVARRLLRGAGVARIEAAGLCTSCEEERFFSHRRDAGRTGRQAGLVWIAEED